MLTSPTALPRRKRDRKKVPCLIDEQSSSCREERPRSASLPLRPPSPLGRPPPLTGVQLSMHKIHGQTRSRFPVHRVRGQMGPSPPWDSWCGPCVRYAGTAALTELKAQPVSHWLVVVIAVAVIVVVVVVSYVSLFSKPAKGKQTNTASQCTARSCAARHSRNNVGWAYHTNG